MNVNNKCMTTPLNCMLEYENNKIKLCFTIFIYNINNMHYELVNEWYGHAKEDRMSGYQIQMCASFLFK